MIARLASALWTRSPADLTEAIWRRVARRNDQAISTRVPEKYQAWLLDELHAFLASSYPGDALARDQFVSLVRKYQDPSWLRASNRYIGDLWYMFAPDYQRRLGEYYRQQDLNLTMTLLSYAANLPFLETNYIRPYEIARQRLGRFSVLEFGAGIPHGFLHAIHTTGTSFCSHVTSVDIEGLPANFFKAFCSRHGVPHRWIAATAGESVRLDAPAPFDFVFAKDVFEHLTDPAASLVQILALASDRAVLALDLDDKGARVYQHVSPVLEPLRKRVEQAGFVPVEHAGNVSIFSRASQK
jgi:hypothetical protein